MVGIAGVFIYGPLKQVGSRQQGMM